MPSEVLDSLKMDCDGMEGLLPVAVPDEKGAADIKKDVDEMEKNHGMMTKEQVEKIERLSKMDTAKMDKKELEKNCAWVLDMAKARDAIKSRFEMSMGGHAG